VGVCPVTHTVCLFVWLIGWLVVCLIITLCSTQCYVEKGYLQDTALTGWHTLQYKIQDSKQRRYAATRRLILLYRSVIII
jgi:hypothetical protein